MSAPGMIASLWTHVQSGPSELVNYLAIAAILFVLGVIAMMTRRNAIGLLMGVELILNAASLNFVAFSRFTSSPWLDESGNPLMSGGVPIGAIDGQLFALFIIVLAAAEAAIALALVLAIFKNRHTIDLDELQDLKH